MPDRRPFLLHTFALLAALRPSGRGMLVCCFSLLLFCLTFLPARAEEGKRGSWQTVIEEQSTTPERLIAVDKSRQQLSLFERRSPLKLTKLLTCSTGQLTGDKELEGDLKTPEGIYFVVQRIGSGLEFLKYGNEAYTLNYPNPVDKLRKKTGYGIWIHGRGEPLTPLQTQGCVALNNDDLASIGGLLVPGTPVALTESFIQSQERGSKDAAVASLLEKRVQAWAKSWGQRSTAMFDFYDKEAYGLAQGEPFSRFQTQKERLFKQLPWIDNSIRDIRVLQGPGYWVTWFYQDYRAPNLSTSGVRRLYWVPDAKGDFKIVGMEWTPGMTTGTLLASAEPAFPPIEAQPRTEEQPAPAITQSTASAAGPGGAPAGGQAVSVGQAAPAASSTPALTVGQAPPAGQAAHPSDASRPGLAPAPASAERSVETPRDAAGALLLAANAPAGNTGKPAPETASRTNATTPPASLSAAGAPSTEKRHFADHVEDPREGKMAEPPASARLLAEKMRAQNSGSASGSGATAASGAGPASGPSTDSAGKPAPVPGGTAPSSPVGSSTRSFADGSTQSGLGLPPALPSQGLAATSRQDGPQSPAVTASSTPPRSSALSSQGGSADKTPEGATLASGPSSSRQPKPEQVTPQPAGQQTVGTGKETSADLRTREQPATGTPARENATPVSAVAGGASAAPAVEKTEPAVKAASSSRSSSEELASVLSARTEAWRKAWESGDLDGYVSFYAPKARQGSRTGAEAIRKHKSELWGRAAPDNLTLDDVRIEVKNSTATVSMRQEYADSNGGGDKGLKILVFEHIKGQWLITQEKWSPLPNEANN